MPHEGKLRVVLCWHMHQPEYRDLRDGTFTLPWTYLHAIKDYTDMAAHLEDHPEAKTVVNFTPVLVEQLADYEQRLARALEARTTVGDRLLDALIAKFPPAAQSERLPVIRACLRANRTHMVAPYPQFRLLYQFAELALTGPAAAEYVTDRFFFDLVTWYHLAWLGETVRREEPVAQTLLGQCRNFTYEQRIALAELIRDLLIGIRGRYASLSRNGQVELATSPYGHPMIPLLIDFRVACEAVPDAALPQSPCYPGGLERVAWHLEQGKACLQDYFDVTPSGCWPSEGGLSRASLQAIHAAGFEWTATGGAVLSSSLRQAGINGTPPGAYRDAQAGLTLFARDDELSDRIGFSYANWNHADAVSDLENALLHVADVFDGDSPLIGIIMDGENAWEHYPANGFYFLSELYRRFSGHDRIALTTFREAVAEHNAHSLSGIVAGSWVYGTFSTWIGEPAKNHAWDMLVEAKRQFDDFVSLNPLSPAERRQLDRQLAVCEGSDWFWWLTEDGAAGTIGEFERLYHLHLANLYRLMGLDPPAELKTAQALDFSASASGEVMRPAQRGSDRPIEPH
jgi:alpha-amylase/alpha-mannosidase (GH57 family)